MAAMQKLSGKTAFITGAGRGIGRALALKLASEGAAIVLNDLDDDMAHAVISEIVEQGGHAISVPGSVSGEGFAETFIEAGLARFGDIDIIVNNAGYTWDGTIGRMSDAQFEAMIDVHLKAPFRILRAAYRTIAERARAEAAEGREVIRKVVNVSSVAGVGGNPGQVNYSAAKSGVIGMTKTLAKEWGRLKVNVNCVAFGYIETRLTAVSNKKTDIEIEGAHIQVGIPENVANSLKAMIPMGRSGSPEEAANAIYLFCIPESNYISGQVVIAGGGLSI